MPIRTSIEIYIEQLGIYGAIARLHYMAEVEKNFTRKQFFNTCRKTLSQNMGGYKFVDADERYRANNAK